MKAWAYLVCGVYQDPVNGEYQDLVSIKCFLIW